MVKPMETPEFHDERDEANWWAASQDLILQHFEEAAKNGDLTRGTTAKRGQTPAITIRLDPADLDMARVQAQEHGMRYQTYLKMILHKALTKASRRSAAEANR